MERVYDSKTFEEALNAVKERLNDPSCVIHENEKRMILMKAEACITLINLQKYITNSWLRFEKMGVM
ncbi:MAG: hypothetical protein ABFD50_15480 [Smithella sp.]